MCFSPAASFAASAILAIVGAATLRQVKAKQQIPFAAIPLLFAIQQFIEGLLWLSLSYSEWEYAQSGLVVSYSFFAGVFWPVFIPTSLLLLEPERKRRRLMAGIAGIGACVSTYALSKAFLAGITARIANACIFYEYPSLPYDNIMLPLYVTVVCAAFFVSSNYRIRWLGKVNIAAFFAAYFFYNFHLTSIWCFFAAIISSLIYFYFRNAGENQSAFGIRARLLRYLNARS